MPLERSIRGLYGVYIGVVVRPPQLKLVQVEWGSKNKGKFGLYGLA